jgi:hypothetical protein
MLCGRRLACHTPRSSVGACFAVAGDKSYDSILGRRMLSARQRLAMLLYPRRQLAVCVAPRFAHAFRSPATSHASRPSCSSCFPVVADLANDSLTHYFSGRSFISVPRCSILNAWHCRVRRSQLITRSQKSLSAVTICGVLWRCCSYSGVADIYSGSCFLVWLCGC